MSFGSRAFGSLFGGSTDYTAPEISSYSPAAGEIDPGDAISFTITDETALAKVVILAEYADIGRTETIYDGASVLEPYDAGSSVVVDGMTSAAFEVVRNDGWIGAFTLRIEAVDADGNLLSSTSEYTLSVTSSPTIDNVSPANGASVTQTTPIEFDVVDLAGTIAHAQISVYLTESDVDELAWDGERFTNQYFQSSRSELSGGHRYSIARRGGWPSGGFKIRARVIDSDGHTEVLL